MPGGECLGYLLPELLLERLKIFPPTEGSRRLVPATTEGLSNCSNINCPETGTQANAPHINILLEECRHTHTLDIAGALGKRIGVEQVCPEALEHLLSHNHFGECAAV